MGIQAHVRRQEQTYCCDEEAFGFSHTGKYMTLESSDRLRLFHIQDQLDSFETSQTSL
jgi:hypothetical protein